MDITTIFGLLIGLGALLFGFYGEGGSLGALWNSMAFLIVFGGTFGAVIASTPMEQLKKVPKILKIVFGYKPRDPQAVIEELVELATVARREGILVLDEMIEQYDDDFFRNGLRLVVDGVDSKLTRSMLELELDYIEQRHKLGMRIFDQAGGFAPTMGIIGTVMGLVHVLGSLDNVEGLGPKVATAFIATLYGVASANVIYIPIATKLRNRSEQEVLIRELMIEGILSLQAGENPTILRQKLRGFLAPAARTAPRVEARDTNVSS